MQDNRSGLAGDLSALLYLVPFAATAVYTFLLWVQQGISPFLPPEVFLSVTREPWLFIVGSVSVILGVAIEVSGADSASRRTKVLALASNLQTMAAASVTLLFVSALYANGFVNIGDAASDILVGRFGLVFPAFLVLLSYLITSRIDVGYLKSRRALGVVLMLLVPATLYAVGRRSLSVGAILAFILILAGFFLLADSRFLRRKTQDKKSPTE